MRTFVSLALASSVALSGCGGTRGGDEIIIGEYGSLTGNDATYCVQGSGVEGPGRRTRYGDPEAPRPDRGYVENHNARKPAVIIAIEGAKRVYRATLTPS